MLRFSIRDLLWLTTLLAVVLVSFVEHQKQTAAYRRLKVELEDTQTNAGISQYNAEHYKTFIQSAYDSQAFWHRQYNDLIKSQEQQSQARSVVVGPPAFEE